VILVSVFDKSQGAGRVAFQQPPRRLTRMLGALAMATALTAGVAGCAEQVIRRGYYLTAGDIQQIQPGMGKEQVRSTLGTPTTASSVNSGSAYYYISSTETQAAFFKPEEKDRQVVAVYFNETETVDRVANYGLKDGRVFDYISRTTPTPGGNEDGILKQLFRNLGTKQLFGT
jgi:outer membrane protein assembly factor BamE (lipoprotein component of BamABCDE complex)